MEPDQKLRVGNRVESFLNTSVSFACCLIGEINVHIVAHYCNFFRLLFTCRPMCKPIHIGYVFIHLGRNTNSEHRPTQAYYTQKYEKDEGAGHFGHKTLRHHKIGAEV